MNNKSTERLKVSLSAYSHDPQILADCLRGGQTSFLMDIYDDNCAEVCKQLLLL